MEKRKLTRGPNERSLDFKSDVLPIELIWRTTITNTVQNNYKTLRTTFVKPQYLNCHVGLVHNNVLI